MKKLISADEYQSLLLKDKALLIYELGEELFIRSDENNNVVKLYILFDFYVEIAYFPVDNKIKQINVISDKNLTENYLSDVDISDLFKKEY